MTVPRWNAPDSKAGTMIRGALWLLQEVGQGNTFTKEQLRQAFPGVGQVDRRIRDLRSYQWVILTNIEDASLRADEQRFVSAGVPVWDPIKRQEADLKTITAKDREEVMKQDGYMCTVCGIAGGEPYADAANQTAVLSVSSEATTLPNGTTKTLLVTKCKRCKSGAGPQEQNAGEVLAAVRDLEPEDRRRLERWVNRGRRGSTPLERAWNAYRRLPAEARGAVIDSLKSQPDGH
ncbi:hypothetical protein CLV92_12417 [Kineococcus xinjiangensis]|uniref:HNH endonuclease n=1 Tax=Kineococcus xinjiangensis TaxID=512762 RepID=A0A2S6IC16_9ACTN|nr:hypothetical protein [Kineococcus xinjiangensis]PPK90791.1 hypothetical protein CLV92_12417 [Kineococcus xinjiangensis]